MEEDSSQEEGAVCLMEALARVPDPRSRHGRRYPLAAMLALGVCAMLCGARSLYAIAQWGREHRQVARALGFVRGTTPCVATWHLLFKRLDRAALERVLGQWFQDQGMVEGEGLAVDGKTLRGIHGEGVPGVHLVAAYAHRRGNVLAQSAVRERGNELTALPDLLDQLPLRGQVVTGDAQFTQRELSRQIVEKGGTTS